MKGRYSESAFLGLTGGMGCGKSTASRFFADQGWKLLDADATIRHHVLPQPEVRQAARDLFGPSVWDAAGHIDRPALAQVIFADEAALAAWEAVVHPRLYACWQADLTGPRTVPCIAEVPLLFEKGLEKWFDFTVCVASSSTLQLSRLAERGMTRALAEQRISKQLPLVHKIEYADFVLSNDGTPDFLRAQVLSLIARFFPRA